MLKLKNIKKTYVSGDEKVEALKGINIEFRKSEFVSILGQSGCGKTTLLNIIGGLDRYTSGDLIINGKSTKDFKDRDWDAYRNYSVGFVFQSYNLIGHQTVLSNVELALTISGVSRKERKQRAIKALEEVGLKEQIHKKPNQLSGGQMQRVAIARALVNEPDVLLLDEPLAALDLKLRKEMQLELKNIQQKLGITFIFVTHDQEEALTMSDTIVVMNKGVIQQQGTPEDIYNEPANAFVANFIGESNIIDGIMIDDYKVSFENHTFDCVDRGFDKNEKIDVVVRPEDIKIVSPENGMLCGKVESIIFKGVHYEICVSIDDVKWILHNTKCVPVNSLIGLDIYPEDIHIMRKVN